MHSTAIAFILVLAAAIALYWFVIRPRLRKAEPLQPARRPLGDIAAPKPATPAADARADSNEPKAQPPAGQPPQG